MEASARELIAPDALAELYRQHAQQLFATAFRLLGTREDAEDVVHDFFVGLPEALRHYEERGTFLAWARRVVARLALSRMRSPSARATTLDDVTMPAARERDTLGGIALADAVASLSPSLRAVLVLREIEGFTHAEVSSMLGISVAASEVRLHRALRSLRTLLGER
ncbi:MAG TPA: sigma-70 family RNA polymerase sigma factor [Gemmatimonadaceae bacterium]|nr:sigma-70 family RNA polymerase sigma factor [Gemmatimonadaceae bacterium]